MALTEKDVERKSLAEVGKLVLGYEQKIKEVAGTAKPLELMTLNSDLAILKKVMDRKMQAQTQSIQRGLPPKAAAAPLKSYDDYIKSKKK